jgi:multimeric flavodoxin WrbA
MKVTAFVGSARKKHTYRATEKFLNHLKECTDIETEIVALSEYNLQICRGCKLCMDRGEDCQVPGICGQRIWLQCGKRILHQNP